MSTTKARYNLTYALTKEYHKTCRVKIAKEMWDSLRVNYEETKDVKLIKITIVETI